MRRDRKPNREILMFQLWFERDLLPQYAHLIEGVAQKLGPASATPERPLADISRAQGIIASARIRYDGALMDQAPSLRVISRTGIGLDNISIPDATARGIAVCNTPDGPTVSTAEHAIALLFAVAKDLDRTGQDLRNGVRKDFFNESRGVELQGLRLGLVGIGRIGSHVAKIAQAIGMRVAAFDPGVSASQAAAKGIERVESLEVLLREADVVSLHAPLSESTRKMINAETLSWMKPTAILINSARGGLIDEPALVAALDEGKLHGAGLDVYEVEPPRPDHPLLSRPNVVCTPHVAGVTGASRDRIWRDAIGQAIAVLRGERIANIVNPEALPKTTRS